MKVLVLVDGLVKGKLLSRTSGFLKVLAEVVDLVLVAECYQKVARSVTKLPFPHETYGFSAEDYDADIRRLSYAMLERHAPTAVICYGWENAQLVYELFRRRLPVVIFSDYPPKMPEAIQHLNWSSQFAETVFMTHEAVRDLPHDWPSKFNLLEPIDNTQTSRPYIFGLLSSQRRDALRYTTSCLVGALRKGLHRLSGVRLQSQRDADVIRASRLFNETLFLDPDEVSDDPIEQYLFDSWRCIPRRRMLAGRLLRRPAAGFHPLVYATQNNSFDETAGEDPLAHFVRTGCPAGAWTHQIIGEFSSKTLPTEIRSALHIHMHYPELLSDLLYRISANDTRPDLFITTTSEDRRMLIQQTLSTHNMTPKLLKCESMNRGRDIWPFIELLRSGVFTQYEIVGHLHGKHSPNNKKGEIWRQFLWRHLVGGPERILDNITDHFVNDAHLGLVIPEDPHLESWGDNLEIATALASKMELLLPLPNHFEFSQGTMFWARPQALAPLIDLDLSADEIPPEPLGEDGTILHAIERLIPFATNKAGFRIAATHVPGCTW